MLPMTEGLALAAMFTLWLVARLARPRAAARSRGIDPIALARLLASQGTATGTIAQQARLPHDVVMLTLHLTRVPRTGKKMPLPASSAVMRQKLSS
jgi:hypothetical protein